MYTYARICIHTGLREHPKRTSVCSSSLRTFESRGWSGKQVNTPPLHGCRACMDQCVCKARKCRAIFRWCTSLFELVYTSRFWDCVRHVITLWCTQITKCRCQFAIENWQPYAQWHVRKRAHRCTRHFCGWCQWKYGLEQNERCQGCVHEPSFWGVPEQRQDLSDPLPGMLENAFADVHLVRMHHRGKGIFWMHVYSHVRTLLPNKHGVHEASFPYGATAYQEYFWRYSCKEYFKGILWDTVIMRTRHREILAHEFNCTNQNI